MSRSASKSMENIADALQSKMDKTNSKVNTFVVNNKMHTINEYVFLFMANLKKIVLYYNLSRNEMLVILQLLEYMKFGNLISVSNSKIARDIGIDPRNMTKLMKRIKETELIIEIDGNIYFNPHVACKGSLDEDNTKDSTLIEYSAAIMQENNIGETSITTKRIRKKFKKDKEEADKEIREKIEKFFQPTEA